MPHQNVAYDYEYYGIPDRRLHTQYHFLPYGVEMLPQPGYILSSSYDQSQAAEQAE